MSLQKAGAESCSQQCSGAGHEMLWLGFSEPNGNVLDETQGDGAGAGEKWLLAADADKRVGFQSRKSQRQKGIETEVPNGGKEVSEFGRLSSCSLFMHFNPLLESWKPHKKLRAFKFCFLRKGLQLTKTGYKKKCKIYQEFSAYME